MDLFLVKLLLSFIVGSIFAYVTLYSAARFGPRVGGIVSGLPSTTAVGLFFIGFSQTPQDASIAAVMVPSALAASLLFVISNLYISRKKHYLVGIAVSTIIWFILALPLALLKNSDLLLATAIYYAGWFIAETALKKIKPEKIEEEISHGSKHLAARSLFAGFIISLAVIVSKYFGPLFGGVMASFPAMFFSMFIILQKDYGWNYTATFAKKIPTGLISVIPYVWAVHYLYPVYGIWAGTVMAYLAAFSVLGLMCVFNRCGK